MTTAVIVIALVLAVALGVMAFLDKSVPMWGLAGIAILEPIMAVEIVTPDQFMGEVIGDLNSRRGQIRGMNQRGNTQVIEAFVPLANMFGYVTDLRSKTQGRAVSTMQFSHYDAVPAAVQEEVVAKVKGG